MHQESNEEKAKYLIRQFIKCPNDYQKIVELSNKFNLEDFVKQTCKRYSIGYSELFIKKLTCRVSSEKNIEDYQSYRKLMALY